MNTTVIKKLIPRRNAVSRVTPRRGFLLEAAMTATLGHFLLGNDATLADKMDRGEMHNKNEDYKQLEQERVEQRLKSLRDSRPMKPNYPGHIPLWTSEKLLLFAVSGLRSFLHPENGVNIVQLGEATAIPPFLNSLRTTMLSDPTGRRILREKPNVSEDQLRMETLAKYPKNTFGYQFYQWCRREKVTPDTRAPVKYIDDPTNAFVFKRYRQCHDFYHALVDMPIIIEGEIIVKALEASNLGVPMAALGAILAPLRLKPVQKKRLYDIYLPWAIRTGLSCKPLINVYWEEQLDKDVNELRKYLGITLPPDLRTMRDKRRQDVKELNLKYKNYKEELNEN